MSTLSVSVALISRGNVVVHVGGKVDVENFSERNDLHVYLIAGQIIFGASSIEVKASEDNPLILPSRKNFTNVVTKLLQKHAPNCKISYDLGRKKEPIKKMIAA